MIIAIAFFAFGLIAGPVFVQVLQNIEKSKKKRTKRKPE